ncbi:MAG: MBL fold metallo-hydrolase [Gemmatimonadales bacterium]|nr:MAG: MBL fold metallo-hydrolase [Gemmatimonadales bacterium]
MKVAMLGSGSRGNATILVGEETRILVDAGFSARQMARRLEVLGIEPESLDAIVVTHDHGDHTRGIGVWARRYGTPVYLTEPTRAVCAGLFRGREEVRSYQAGRPFRIGEFRVDPFLTVHDAADPVAVTVYREGCGTRVGIATDLGRPTAGIRHSLAGCDFLILEANHDERMLRSGPYPVSVQARIASSHGHLSNHAAADFARELLHPRLAGILLAHLSAECNRPELALDVVGGVLRKKGYQGYLAAAGQDEPTELLVIEELRERYGPGQLSLL